MKEGDQAQETRIERCTRLTHSSSESSTPQSNTEQSSVSSSAQWKQDALEWEKQKKSNPTLPSTPRKEWDFEKQSWTDSKHPPPSSPSLPGPMREMWMQIHRSLRSLSQNALSTSTLSPSSKDSKSSISS